MSEREPMTYGEDRQARLGRVNLCHRAGNMRSVRPAQRPPISCAGHGLGPRERRRLRMVPKPPCRGWLSVVRWRHGITC